MTPNQPDRANRRQALGFRARVGDACVRGFTAAVAHPGRSAAAHPGQIRHLMKKAPNGQFLLGAFALSFAALLSAGQSTPTPIAAELKRLQGYWEGEGAGGKCSITITGNSLHYRAGTNWWKTTF